MAPTSLSEIEIVQNTALAATMIWRCGLGYQDESGSSPMPFHLSFLVLPVCMHKDTLDHVLSTQKRSGLSMFAAKVAQNREDLLAVHLRALAFRDLTLASVGVGIRTKFLSVDYRSAQLRSNTHPAPKNLPERIKPHIQGAERFGAWCGRLPLEQIGTTLQVDF